MNTVHKIPILNLYYLLLYAWNRLEEAGQVDVSPEDATSLLNLFSRVLISGSRYLLKRGLDRGYIDHSEDIRGLKGKIDFSATIKRQLQNNAMLRCSFDELSYNVLHNRILRTTIRNLVVRDDIDKRYRSDLADIHRRLDSINEIDLSGSVFKRVQLHRNNAFYGFLMDICELIYNYYVVTEDLGDRKFREFIRDEKTMSKLFEEFVRNFYKIELKSISGYSVKNTGEQINWDVKDPNEPDTYYLPRMVTDISIRTPYGYLIIDTKYYKEAMKGRWEDKIYSPNLYQIFAYVKNIQNKGPHYENCSGILLYPTVQADYEFSYIIQGHAIAVKTIDLAKPWQEIEKKLLSIVNT